MANSLDDGGELRDAPVGELIKRLSGDMSLLLRQEFDLFRTEMMQKLSTSGKRVGEGAGMLSAAAVTGLLALATLTTTVILLLALVMPAWTAALIVTAVYGIAAAALAISGKRKIEGATVPVPTQTIETVKEDVEWAKTQTKSARR